MTPPRNPHQTMTYLEPFLAYSVVEGVVNLLTKEQLPLRAGAVAPLRRWSQGMLARILHHPDLAMVDTYMPMMGDMEATRALLRCQKEMSI